MDFVKTYGLVDKDDDHICETHPSVKAFSEKEACILMCKKTTLHTTMAM